MSSNLAELDNSISLTDQATKQITALQEQNGDYVLKLEIKGGGCSGFLINFVDHFGNIDRSKYTVHGSKGKDMLIVDGMSIFFVKDSELDYVNTISKEGFCLISNPNKKSGCGCGQSFQPK